MNFKEGVVRVHCANKQSKINNKGASTFDVRF